MAGGGIGGPPPTILGVWADGPVSSVLVAAVQLTSTPDPDINFAAAEELIELAARRGAELVGLPENFAFMGADQ